MVKIKKNPGFQGRPKVPVYKVGETERPGEVDDYTKPLPIRMDQVIYWIGLGATKKEIAGSFRIHEETFDKRLRESCGMTYQELKNRVGGEQKIRLRHYQYQMARDNPSMAIFLGKVWLNQREDPTDQGIESNEKLDLLIKNLRSERELHQLKQELKHMKGSEDEPE